MDDILYSVVDTAKLLKISKNKTYELVKAGLLPGIKLGGLKIRKSTIEKFLADYEGYDLTDLANIKKLDFENLKDED